MGGQEDPGAMRVSIIGAGLQGRRRAGALRHDDGDRLVAVADIDLQAARCLASRYGAHATVDWRAAVEHPDVEAVLVCTPPSAHAPAASAALGLGRHVLCEKPLAHDLPSVREMVTAPRQNGAILKCGFNHRHHPGLRQAHEWVSEGRIGLVTHIVCRYGIGGRPGYEREWRGRPEAGGGQLMDQGMHVLDLFRWFMGEFQTAFGVLATSYWPVEPLEDNVFAILTTKAGGAASLHASWTRWRNLFSFEVFGRDGYAAVEGLGGSYGTERAILGPRAFLEPFREEVVEYRGDDTSWSAEWEEFVAATQEGRQPLGSGEDGLEAQRMADAIYRSARTGRRERIQ